VGFVCMGCLPRVCVCGFMVEELGEDVEVAKC
jgi:hypothetical protein